MFDLLLTQGPWESDQVRCAWAGSTFNPDEKTLRQIETAWRDAKSVPGKILFDGEMCRLEEWEESATHLTLRVSRTSYKMFMGTNCANARTYPLIPLANPLGLSVAIESSDGYLLMGKRNAKVAYYPNRIHPFAGAMEPSSDLNVFSDARRELHEELKIESDEIAEMTLLGMVADRSIRQPELIFHVLCPLSRDEIQKRLDDTEHAGAVAFNADDLDRELLTVDSWTPVGIATACFWGGIKLGLQWFNRKITHFTLPTSTVLH
jgi:hypothetical protein